MLNKSNVFLIGILVFSVTFISCSKEQETPLIEHKITKMGISIKIPEGLKELESMHVADDNLFAIGSEDECIVISRSPGFSIQRKYPNLPPLGISLIAVQTDAMGAKLIKLDRITIAGNEYYYGAKEVEIPGKTKAWIMRAFFWSEEDGFDASVTTLPSTFKQKEILFKKVVESISFLERTQSKRHIKTRLLPLPKKYSEIAETKRKDVHIENIKIEGLPPNFKRLRHIWKIQKLTDKGVMDEEVWAEYLVSGDDLFYIRQKIVTKISPFVLFNTPEITATIITLLLKETIGLDKFSDEEKFHVWALTATAAHFHGRPVDTRFDGDGFSISVKRKGDDLVVEIARPETMRTLEAFEP